MITDQKTSLASWIPDKFSSNWLLASLKWLTYLKCVQDLLKILAWLAIDSIKNKQYRVQYRGSSHSAVLPQRGFPSYTDVLVLVRGGVRTFYLINSSNTVFFEQAQKSVLQEDPLYKDPIKFLKNPKFILGKIWICKERIIL